MARIDWSLVVERAAEIVDSYDTGVTLRQLFYRLVAEQVLPNTQNHYRRLSSKTAEARRDGTFPDLLDRQSRIERRMTFDGPDEAQDWLRNQYRRDRTEGQPWTIFIGVEKAGMSEQLDAWFTDPLRIPHVALGGYASQSLCDKVKRNIIDQERPAALLYAGDFDPTGIDIDRDFVERVGKFDKVVRVALSKGQIRRYRLVHNPDAAVARKLENDPRSTRFKQLHGDLVQYEVDALAPDALQNLYQSALDRLWDSDVYHAVIESEATEREHL